MSDALGLYLSIPFCRAKCTFCNFASDAFASTQLPRYLGALAAEIACVRDRAAALGANVADDADTIYLGGGTPSLLAPGQISTVFAALRSSFRVAGDAEITVECAPGQLSEASLDAFVRQGVNRLSFGVQSFVDAETRSVGRSHTAAACLHAIASARGAGIRDISLDLIAGLPGQTEASWLSSVAAALECGASHASVYMLEVDGDSRLGREVLAGGSRYGAATIPSDDQCVDLYELACERFEAAGMRQYEISNFARPGRRSRHNMKYWRRAPYLGFGLDAHSMLPLAETRAVRFANAHDLDVYLAGHGEYAAGAALDSAERLRVLPSGVTPSSADRIGPAEALEETLFLGLRMNDGIELNVLRARFGEAALRPIEAAIADAIEDRLLETVRGTAEHAEIIRLTRCGRALANEVFARLLAPAAAAA